MNTSIGKRRLNIDALRKRLRENNTPSRSNTPVQPATPISSIPTVEQDKLLSVLGGEMVAGCQVITKRYEASHTHGQVALGDLFTCRSETLAQLAKDKALSRFDFRRTLFLDTETNGLAGGAGTYAFLVGVAYWENDAFYVRQFFMRHPSQEHALLHNLALLLEKYDSFVTFNGKSFDLPVLETRYILARQPRALKRRLHLDLLHPARRLWKLRLNSCRLGNLEERILHLTRHEADVPGYLIPQLYNDFLRDGDPVPLEGIFYHNHQDLLSLASLAVYMARLYDTPEQYAAPHGHDFFSVARLYEDNKEWARAEAAYRRTLQFPIPQNLRYDCMRRLSFLLKRQEKWQDATSLWRAMLRRGELYPYEELAKYHEHHSRNLHSAEKAVLAALDAAQQGVVSLTTTDREDLRYRLARIRRKLATKNKE